MKILTIKNEDNNLRYIFHCMESILYSPSEHSRQWIEKYSKIKIPLPPLAKQERIVAIQDRFDALCHDLTSGLPAEIAARKKRYEYYRDKLLQFPK